jgi:aminopeptidase N
MIVTANRPAGAKTTWPKAAPTEQIPSPDRFIADSTPPQNNLPKPSAGAAGAGDSLFPLMGNGGYKSKHYTIELDVDVAKNNFNSARTTLDATATQDLSAFNLDFKGFDIAQITVNGKEAQFKRDEGELTITPDQPLLKGQDFQVSVQYSGQPQPVQSDSAPVTIGWNGFSGGTYVVSEPEGSPGWYPCNDHPTDKATYTFKVTVDNPYIVAANGKLESTCSQGDKTTYTFEAHDPMASYLTTVHIGNYTRVEDQGANGLPIRHYFPSDMVEVGKYDFGRTPEMLDYFSQNMAPTLSKTMAWW